MSEKKTGFFKRMFGGEKNQPDRATIDDKAADETDQKSESVEQKVEDIPPVEEEKPAVEAVESKDALSVPEPKVAPELEPEVLAGNSSESESRPEPSAKTTMQPEKKDGWFSRLASGLKRTSDQLGDNIGAVFTKKKLDAATLEELEDVLIQADLGVETAMAIVEALEKDRFDKEISTEDVRKILAVEVEKTLTPVAVPFEIDGAQKPFVVLMVGVNGSGKTTTIGKLADKFTREGKKVLLAAGDTFRAAAIEQLEIWGERTSCEVIVRPAGSDASGLAFDAVVKAKETAADVLIIDTAGRLQNRDELMAELEKIIRVIKKVDAGAPHAVLLTLDATTGQNALQQVEIFAQRAGVSGLVMTKLDGTARGGILVAIAKKYAMPVHFIGVGEGLDDLEPFAPKDFAAAIAGRTAAG